MSRYKFVRCNSCGWHQDVAEDERAGDLLVAHLEDCESSLRALLVPMWSVAWPWYWGENQDLWGLEMQWRPVGSHATRLGEIGSDPKTWVLFPLTEVGVR